MPASLQELGRLSEWLSSQFKVPPPRIVVTGDISTLGLYVPEARTIFVRPDVLYDERLARKVVLHETAHHVDAVRGWTEEERESELLAHAFEIYAYGGSSRVSVTTAAVIAALVGAAVGLAAALESNKKRRRL